MEEMVIAAVRYECPYKNQSGCAGREPPAGSADIPGRRS